MRLLFAFVGGRGHLEPLVPVARAARAAGHDVIGFACRRSMVSPVQDAGFAAFEAGPDVPDPTGVSELLEPDPAREDRVLRVGFANVTARRRATDLIALCRAERPEVIVADEVDVGAFVAAEHLGIPHASVVVLAAGGFARAELLAEPLESVRSQFGLPPDPSGEMLHRHLVIAPLPPSFRDPAHPLPGHSVAIRPAALDASEHRELWFPGDGRTHVYMTLGTIFAMESGDLFERLTAAADDLDADVLLTVGPHLDPATLGPQASHVRIERYVDQAAVLPRADVVVSHGGSGSVVGALSHGVPLVLLPMGADQPHNARRCQQLGVGCALDVSHATATDIRATIDGVLETESYRRRARQLAEEAAALPDAHRAVQLLEGLTS